MTHRQARMLLKSLGDTAEEVRDTLVGLGIKGTHCRNDCPLARYLKREGAIYAYVGKIDFCVDSDDYLICDVPEGASHFVFAFDGGQYPELWDREAAERAP